MASRTEVQVLPPKHIVYEGLSVSPDDNYVYFISAPEGIRVSPILYVVPVLGGTPRKLTEDVDSPVTFSPDGSRIAYVRLSAENGRGELLTNNTDGTDERLVSWRKIPEIYMPLGRLAWSPDGKSITLSALTKDNRSELVEVPLGGGPEKILTTGKWQFVYDPLWLADHSGIVFDAAEPGTSNEQLWLLSYPGWDARPITKDAKSYTHLSLCADSTILLASQGETTSTLWIAPKGKAERARRITSGDKDNDGVEGLTWTPDGHIVFASNRGGNLDLWTSDADGNNARQLTLGAGSNSNPAVSPDGRTIVFVSTRTGAISLWKMDINGENPMELTRGGLEMVPKVTPNGKDVVYESLAPKAVWKIPLAGGEPTLIAKNASRPSISPDGKLLVVTKSRDNPPGSYLDIFPLAGGPSIKQFDLPLSEVMTPTSWSHDGNGLIYVDSREGVDNLWLLSLLGDKPRQITNFASDRIYAFAWSQDGKQLMVVRRGTSRDIVTIRNFR